MSGLLERLGDLASRTLATARAPRSARPDHEPAPEAPPDAAREPTSMPAESHQAAVATEVGDRVSVPGGDVELATSRRSERDAASLPRAVDEALPATPEQVVAPRPTADGPTGPTAEAEAPTAEKRRPETGIAMAPPATPEAGARPSAPPRNVAPQPLDALPAPEPGSTIRAAAGADQTASIARPGLLRDAEIRVVSAVDAVRGAPVDRQPDDALPELKERWRELGARLRATHPPPAPGARREGTSEGEASTRPEAADPPAVALARPPTRLAPGGPTAAQHRPELIIRHLEIRIVAAAKEAAPLADTRSPAPVTGAWQIAARRYLRL
jgi:ribonuclease E